MILTCKICGYSFYAPNRRFDYCITCKPIAKARVKKKTREKHGDKNKTIEVQCAVCGKSILKNMRDYNRSKKLGHKLVCSKECVYLAKFNGIYKPCVHCGKMVWVTPSTDRKCNYCSRECMDLDNSYILRQETHYRWRGGESSKPHYRGLNWGTIKKRIRERDGYQCQICGLTEKDIGKKMDVHHITPYRLFQTDEEANREDNLICLCPSCHHRQDAMIKE